MKKELDWEKFLADVRELNDRMDVLDEQLVEQKIQLFGLGIEIEELKGWVENG